MISTNKKFIFIHIPKTGGTSIEFSLKDLLDEQVNFDYGGGRESSFVYGESGLTVKHATAMELINGFQSEETYEKGYGENKFNEYLKFSVIRNPWDRLLSLYFWGSDKVYNKKRFINFLPNNKEEDCDLPTENRTLWSINKYICDENDNLLMDKLITFEEINNGFNEICNDLNIENALPHMNKSRVGKTSYKDIMDNEVIERINTYYQKEIKKFWS